MYCTYFKESIKRILGVCDDYNGAAVQAMLGGYLSMMLQLHRASERICASDLAINYYKGTVMLVSCYITRTFFFGFAGNGSLMPALDARCARALWPLRHTHPLVKGRASSGNVFTPLVFLSFLPLLASHLPSCTHNFPQALSSNYHQSTMILISSQAVSVRCLNSSP